MTDTEQTAEPEGMQFYIVAPKGTGFSLNPEEPTLTADDLDFWEKMVLFTVVLYLRQMEGEEAAEKFIRVCDVEPESVAFYLDDKMPTHSWWRMSLSRAREAQSEEQAAEEGQDWADIGNFAMGLYTLHQSATDYPVSLLTMLRIYTEVIEHQLKHPEDGVRVVDDVHAERFNASCENFWAALYQRMQTFEAVTDDTKTCLDAFPLFGDIAEMTKWGHGLSKNIPDEEAA